MHSLSSLIVIALSFVSLAVAGPLTPTAPSSPAKNPISSRQYRYPRTLLDICAPINLDVQVQDLLGLDLGVLGDICLCLSAFPLNLDLYVNLQVLTNLLGDTKVNVLLQALVDENGSQCTIPDHAHPICTTADPCGFTCTDGFVHVGNTCVCPPPSTVCNGKCGSYGNGCTSAVPKAPKMARRSIASYDRRGSPDAAGLKLGGSKPSSVPDLNGLVTDLVKSSGISSGGNRADGLDLNVPIYVSVDLSNLLSGTDGLIPSLLALVEQILNSLLGKDVTTKLSPNPTSVPTTPGLADVVIDIDLTALLGPELSNIVEELLAAVSKLLTDLLRALGLDLDLIVLVNLSSGPDLKWSRTIGVKA